MRKEASLEQWKALYEVAINLGILKPWEELWDTNLIAVQLKKDEEPVFLSVMGKAGTCYGISVYEGIKGLQGFEMIEHQEERGIPILNAMMDQNSLVCYWGDREEVPARQKKVIKDLGLKFYGRGNWIYFQTYESRYAPYTPDEREVVLLTEAFQNLFMAVRAVKENRIQVQWDKGECLCRFYNEETKLWNMITAPFPEVERQYPFIQLQDEVLIKRLQKRPENGSEILLDFLFLNGAIQDKKYDKPVTPYLFVALDDGSGMILDIKMLQPEDKEIDLVLNFFIPFVLEHGKMACIRFRNPWVKAALDHICSKCGIRLEADLLEEMDMIALDLEEQVRL